ncbi:hypothetical protein EJ05DRAFT_534282 [Pseudovirgaria hyperparasitica]|uniref:Uncharacterized protein n=1 Tax=Pseudovirgaria hyperparasitica TaxID=470096 RepID=A0A6A6WKV6_9PEZI|nr:uncharacterized protein EJ05DRAFT_534282 [Pseudovirgaria hyperparasitica]KAF2762806.1 hypothetical protein EJ05DRAFT_534282 [Pseudovirgaria hyperparasitica]
MDGKSKSKDRKRLWQPNKAKRRRGHSACERAKQHEENVRKNQGLESREREVTMSREEEKEGTHRAEGGGGGGMVHAEEVQAGGGGGGGRSSSSSSSSSSSGDMGPAGEKDKGCTVRSEV